MTVQVRIVDSLRDGASYEHLAEIWRLQAKDPITQYEAAEAARATCAEALDQLKRAVALCDSLPSDDELSSGTLMEAMAQLADIHSAVARVLGEAIEENLEWCRRGVTTEVAYASAEKDTDFDAAELLSGVLIAQWSHRISRAEVADAVRHSFRAAHDDGSWHSSQPIYLEKRVLGVWANTPDLVLLLASAVKPFHGLQTADERLRQFIGWLDARMEKVNRGDASLWGWPSEARERGIDIWSTATAVKALLEIREIFEDRLWEICEKRFTILRNPTPIRTLDPVDLGAQHQHRLHRRLFTMASETRHARKDAEYSFVLHGPPGSSKSAVAQAIGASTWRGRLDERGAPRSPRIVRITPADFTRRGQEGLDVEARFIFHLLSHVRGVTVLFDEIDDLLRLRKIDSEPTFIRLVIPGMLNRLQDLHDAAERQEICFLLATNYIDQIEPALTRPGRIDDAIPVPYPDAWSRESILERIATKAGERLPDEVRDAIVAGTAEWPWSTYQKLCKDFLNASRELTLERAQALLKRFGEQLQSSDYYYRNKKRWRTPSPLVKEIVHFSFATSKDRETCYKRATSLTAEYDAVANEVAKIFNIEWERQRRN